MLITAGAEGGDGSIGEVDVARAGMGENFANAGGRESRKFLMPRGFETGAVLGGDGEKEFEILAIAEGVMEGVGRLARGRRPTPVMCSSRVSPSAVSPPRMPRFHLRAAAIMPS